MGVRGCVCAWCVCVCGCVYMYMYTQTYTHTHTHTHTQGEELKHPALASKLAHQTTFTQQEWDAFKIRDLRHNHYVYLKAAASYFRPVSPLRIACHKEGVQVPHEASHSNNGHGPPHAQASSWAPGGGVMRGGGGRGGDCGGGGGGGQLAVVEEEGGGVEEEACDRTHATDRTHSSGGRGDAVEEEASQKAASQEPSAPPAPHARTERAAGMQDAPTELPTPTSPGGGGEGQEKQKHTEQEHLLMTDWWLEEARGERRGGKG